MDEEEEFEREEREEMEEYNELRKWWDNLNKELYEKNKTKYNRMMDLHRKYFTYDG